MSAFVAKHGPAEEGEKIQTVPCPMPTRLLYDIPPSCPHTYVQIQKGGKRTLSCGDICYRLAAMLAIRSTLVSPLRNVLLRNYTHTEGSQNQSNYSVLW